MYVTIPLLLTAWFCIWVKFSARQKQNLPFLFHRARYIRSFFLLAWILGPCLLRRVLPYKTQLLLLGSVFVSWLVCESTFYFTLGHPKGSRFRSAKWRNYWFSFWLKTGVICAVVLPGATFGIRFVDSLSKSLGSSLWSSVIISFLYALLFSLGLLSFIMLCNFIYRYPEIAAPLEKEKNIEQTLKSLGISNVTLLCYDDEIMRNQWFGMGVTFNPHKKRLIASYSLLNSLSSSELEALTIQSVAAVKSQSLPRIALEVGLMLWAVYTFLDLPIYKRLSGFWSGFVYLLAFAAIIFVMKRLFSRKHFRNDQLAVKLGANPQALVAALQKQTDLNLIPRNRSIPLYHPGNGTPSVDDRERNLTGDNRKTG